MKHIAAYALAILSGKDKVTAADIEKILKAGGVKSDEDQLNKLISSLEGKTFHEVKSCSLIFVRSSLLERAKSSLLLEPPLPLEEHPRVLMPRRSRRRSL